MLQKNFEVVISSCPSLRIMQQILLHPLRLHHFGKENSKIYKIFGLFLLFFAHTLENLVKKYHFFKYFSLWEGKISPFHPSGSAFEIVNQQVLEPDPNIRGGSGKVNSGSVTLKIHFCKPVQRIDNENLRKNLFFYYHVYNYEWVFDFYLFCKKTWLIFSNFDLYWDF